jgi:branched-chain amino acid aminotransferase
MGVCNLFFLWKNKEGETELVTPELDGTILPGVTRDAVIRLASKMNKFKVTEKKLYMNELVQAVKEKRV